MTKQLVCNGCNTSAVIEIAYSVTQRIWREEYPKGWVTHDTGTDAEFHLCPECNSKLYKMLEEHTL